MKYLILILLFTINAQAKNWFPVDKSQAKTGYPKQSRCESLEGQSCYDISICPLNICILGQVDNTESPKFLKKNIEVCTDEESCSLIHSTKDCITDLSEGSMSIVAFDYTEVYCAEPDGFNQMPGLVEDQTLKDAVAAEDAQKIADKAARDAAKPGRDIALEDCSDNTKSGVLSLPTATACIRAIIRELQGDKIPIDDL